MLDILPPRSFKVNRDLSSIQFRTRNFHQQPTRITVTSRCQKASHNITIVPRYGPATKLGTSLHPLVAVDVSGRVDAAAERRLEVVVLHDRVDLHFVRRITDGHAQVVLDVENGLSLGNEGIDVLLEKNRSFGNERDTQNRRESVSFRRPTP